MDGVCCYVCLMLTCIPLFLFSLSSSTSISWLLPLLSEYQTSWTNQQLHEPVQSAPPSNNNAVGGVKTTLSINVRLYLYIVLIIMLSYKFCGVARPGKSAFPGKLGDFSGKIFRHFWCALFISLQNHQKKSQITKNPELKLLDLPMFSSLC